MIEKLCWVLEKNYVKRTHLHICKSIETIETIFDYMYEDITIVLDILKRNMDL